MSRALAHAAPLKPEVRLAQAVSEFERKLSTQEKTEIRNNTRVPDMDDIMRLTAEIDMVSSAKANERRRCYGPRVTKFLEGLHQFAGTVDSAVSGAVQNPAVSGVWAVVRFSLLALTKYSPYIEKLSKLLMEVSRTTPLLKEMSKLYHRSKRIQDSLFEYYIVVVQLCQELYNLSQMNTMSQIWTAFSEESYQKQLESWSQAIQTEVYLENAKLAREESKKSVTFRSFSQKHMELQRRQQKQELKQRVLDACSQYNYRTIWKQTRKLGNTTSFNEATGYVDWIRAKTSCTLLYSGRLGSGKSVLLANIVGDLFLKNDVVSSVAYFFCRYDTADSLVPRTIIGCLARQVLQHLPDMDALEDKIEASSYSNQFDFDELLQFIEISVTKPVHFVLDGVDDLTIAQKHELFDAIYDLQQKIPLLVCISTCFPQDIFHGTHSSENILYASIPKLNIEIEAYVDSEIDHRLATGTLMISDDELVQEVKEKLNIKSQGMFLWVYLQIANLCSMTSDFEIREALSNLPDGIVETYNRLLQGCDHVIAKHRQHLFELILVAYEPLHSEELLEALSVEPGMIEYDPAKLLNSINGIIQSCRGLVMVDEEETTVRLVHFSTHQFLISSAYENRIDEASAQHRMSEVILTYLNYPIFESQIAIRRPQTLSSSAIPAAILIKTVPMASKFVRLSQNSRLDRTLANAGKPEVMTNSFKTYALSYWDKHLVSADQNDSCLKMLGTAMLKNRVDFSKVSKSNQFIMLQRAVKSQSLDLTRLILERGVREDDKLAALGFATTAEHVEMTDMLVKEFVKVNKHDMLFKRSIERNDHFLMKSLLRNCKSEVYHGSYRVLAYNAPRLFAVENETYSIDDLLLKSLIPRSIDRLNRPSLEMLFYSAIRVRNLDGLRLLANRIPAYQLDQNELWIEVFKCYLGIRTVADWESLHRPIATFLIELKYLDPNYQLRLPSVDFLPHHCLAGLHSPLAHASYHGLTGLVKAILDFDPTTINKRVQTGHIVPQGTPYDHAKNDKIRALLVKYGGRSGKGLWDESLL